jgi:AraC-like DNA-binding protein
LSSAADEFRVYRPAPELRSLVHCYYTLRGPADGAPQTIFPDGRMDLVVQLGDPFVRLHDDGSIEPQPRALLVGQMRGFVRIAPRGAVHSFGIRFRPGGSEAFLRIPADETEGRILSLDDIANRLSQDLRARLELGSDPVTAVDAVLLGNLSASMRPQPAVDSALDGIIRSGGTIPVHRLARESGLTPRHLERVFRARVGITPKAFARIVRFQRVLRSTDRNWAAIAAECGYTDQAHLIHDFREFTGQTPTAWRASQVAFLQDFAATAG